MPAISFAISSLFSAAYFRRFHYALFLFFFFAAAAAAADAYFLPLYFLRSIFSRFLSFVAFDITPPPFR